MINENASWCVLLVALVAALAVGPALAAESGGRRKAGTSVVSPRKLIQADRVLIIAHRGASAYAPENTLAAFELAIKQKADLIEDDYHVTKGGKLIAIHDGTLDRTTNAIEKWGGKKITVRSKTLTELRQLDAGSWKDPKFSDQKLPTFKEAALTMLKGSVPLLERKSGSAEQTLVDLKEIDAVEKVVVQAFDWTFLRSLHKLEPKIVLGALGGGKIPPPKVRVIKRTGASVVGWSHKDLDAETIDRLHDAGLRVWAYTVDHEKDIRRLVKMGIDGIITNRPDTTRKVVDGLK